MWATGRLALTQVLVFLVVVPLQRPLSHRPNCQPRTPRLASECDNPGFSIFLFFVSPREIRKTDTVIPMKPDVSHEETISRRRASLSRRRFLRGVGVSMALPAFESLLAKGVGAAGA